MLFGVAALVALAIAALVPWRRARLRPLLLAAVGFAAILAPWRIFMAVEGFRNTDYTLSDALSPGYLADRTDRARVLGRSLWTNLTAGHWGYVELLVLAGLVACLLAGRPRLAAFGALWLALSFAGLALTLWISTVAVDQQLTNTTPRVIDTLVVGGVSLAALMAGEAARLVPAPGRYLAARRSRASASASGVPTSITGSASR
jgi:hypothetical protein